MKVYRRLPPRYDVVEIAEVEDGAECMSIGALPDGRDEPAIAMIDFNTMTFARQGQKPQPFPAKWYRPSDLKWEPA